MSALAGLLSYRLRLGRVWGVDVWVHISLLVAVVAALVWLRHAPLHALLFVTVLFASVLAHELAHCWGARRVGGSAREVVLWPLGGLAQLDVPMAPGPQLVATACGPLVNLALGLLALPPFLLLGGGWSFGAMTVVGGPAVLGMIVGVNLALAFFNLIPAYPMDGGRILQALLWPRLGYERATETAIKAALVTAVVLGAWALFTGQTLLLVIMALVISAALAERQELRAAGVPPPRWPAAEEVRRAGWFERWRERRRQAREDEEERRREAVRERLDRVLQKVSAGGMQALTREERRFLRDASQALRREHDRV